MDDRLRGALRRLRGNPDFQIWLEHVQAMKDQAGKAGLTLDDQIRMYRAQGNHEALNSMLVEIEVALQDPPLPRQITPQKFGN